jgi:hypothetical protein
VVERRFGDRFAVDGDHRIAGDAAAACGEAQEGK